MLKSPTRKSPSFPHRLPLRILALALILLLTLAACGQDAGTDGNEPTGTAATAIPTVPPATTTAAAPTVETDSNDGTEIKTEIPGVRTADGKCHAGMVLKAGESCDYEISFVIFDVTQSKSFEFRVGSDGNASWVEENGASVAVDVAFALSNQVDGDESRFAVQQQSDGTYFIEEASTFESDSPTPTGTPVPPTPPPTATPAPPTPTPTPTATPVPPTPTLTPTATPVPPTPTPTPTPTSHANGHTYADTRTIACPGHPPHRQRRC